MRHSTISLIVAFLLITASAKAKDIILTVPRDALEQTIADKQKGVESVQVKTITGEEIRGKMITVGPLGVRVLGDAQQPNVSVAYDQISEIRLQFKGRRARRVAWTLLGTVPGAYIGAAIGYNDVDSTKGNLVGYSLAAAGGYLGYKHASRQRSTIVLRAQ
jgi:hypothetical protein